MSMLSEFKDFAMKGNVVDMAVGVVIGGAFKSIVTSFTNDILMPPVGLLLGGVDFSQLSVKIQEASGGENRQYQLRCRSSALPRSRRLRCHQGIPVEFE